MDAAMASLLILQTAVDEGLGACFFGIPPEHDAAVRAAFGIPGDVDPVGAITLGHRPPDEAPSGSPTTRQRRGQTEVVHRGRWRLTPHQSTGPTAAGSTSRHRASVSGPRYVAPRRAVPNEPASAQAACPSVAAMTDRAVAKLQALVRIPTVSDRDPARVDTAAFDRLLDELRGQFPLLHERLELTRVGTHGLLFHWRGRGPTTGRSC